MESGEKRYAGFEYIKSWLDIPHFLMTGTILKVSSTLGDRMATAILKAIHPSRRVDDVKLRKILAVLNAAFEYPEMVEDESDRRPAVTVSLLEMLKTNSESSAQKQEIESALQKFS